MSEQIETGRDGFVRLHCNGQRWEKRTFQCGAGVAWAPNNSEERPFGECRHHPDVLARAERREKAARVLYETVASLDLGDVDRGEVFRALQLLPWWKP